MQRLVKVADKVDEKPQRDISVEKHVKISTAAVDQSGRSKPDQRRTLPLPQVGSCSCSLLLEDYGRPTSRRLRSCRLKEGRHEAR